MFHTRRAFFQILLPGAALAAEAAKLPVRCGVINGMMMAGLWPAVAERFTAATGWPAEVVVSGERHILDPQFRKGGIDLLTMHSGDVTTNLVADGFARNMRPWTRNELVIAGPEGDPCGLRGLRDGAKAMLQLRERGGKLVDFRDIGSREVLHTLMDRAGIEPGDWLLPDRASDKRQIAAYAVSLGAHCIVGAMPLVYGRMSAPGGAILVSGDPAMRRPYCVLEADPRRFPQANVAGARAFADFLVAPETQRWLADFGRGEREGAPFFFPVASEGAR